MIFLLCIVLIGGLGAGAVGYKLYKKVKGQEETLQDIQLSIDKDKIETSQKAAVFDNSIFKEDTYNYLAIGNSITSHGITSYWWNQGVGMAASDADHDYFHMIVNSLEKSHGKEVVAAKAIGGYQWEAQYYDRAECLPMIGDYLSDKLDLVTIQLGENAKDTSTLEKDFEDLIELIQDKAPKAQILMIGEFWKDSEKDVIKKQACKTKNINFVDLSSCWDDESYQAGMGTTVYDSEGDPHVIEHSGVAKHPGDKGMQFIAEQVIKQLN